MMGTGTSRPSEKKKHVQNSEGQKMENDYQAENQRNDREIDMRHKDGFKTPLRSQMKKLKDSDHQAETDGAQRRNGETRHNEEQDIHKEEEEKLKLNVKQQMKNISTCKEVKVNSHKVVEMSKRLQQFCIAQGLTQTDELRMDSEATNTLAKKRQEKTRLLHKLSETAGTRLKHNNPNLADLSDENRPTKLVNRLSELYDNDWTDIFERVREKIGHDVDDKEIICYLRDILKQCYDHCRIAADTQRKNILQRLTDLSINEAEPTLLLYITNLQKKSAECSIKFLTTSIKGGLRAFPEGKLLKDNDPVYCKYVEGCTEIMWYTQIQSPPIFLDFESTNKDWFKKFTSPGQVIDYIVWPVVFLHENGPLLAKGIAQFSKAKEKETTKTQVFHMEDESRADNVMAESSVEANQSDVSNIKANTLTVPVVTESTVKINEEQQKAKVETMIIKDKIDKRKTGNEVGTNVKRPKPHKNKRK